MRVLILGLGQYPKGSGVSAALYFAWRGDDVTVTDLKDEQALKMNVQRLKNFTNVHFVLGRHRLVDVKRAELIVRNPRIRSDSPEMKEAARLGIPIESDISIFLAQCPAPVIGVTGTRGKSTTTALIYEMLKAERKKRPAWLGGNMLISPLTFLSRIKKHDRVVLELSSWQLEATGAKGISPHIAVWTNLMRDHLNTYPSMADYAEAKAQIFRHQKPDDVVFLPADKSFNVYAQEAPSRVVRFGRPSSREAKIVKSVKMKLLGEHNVKNAQIATAVAFELGVPIATIKKVLHNFQGLPNRLETIAVKKGITFVNDTTATTPDATIAAIKSLKDKGKMHLIFGGADKELEFDEVARAIKKSGVQVLLLPGTAHKKIVKALDHTGVKYTDVNDLRGALKQTQSFAKKGDLVLLSPGCASFGLFKNEYDRGEQFKKLVKRV